jgi:pilus assembly protein CpaB
MAAAISASVVVYYLLASVSLTAEQSAAASRLPAATAVPTRYVIVAATDIPASSVISTSHVITASYPADLVPSDAVTSMSEVLSTTVRTPVFSGQMMLKRQFMHTQGRASASLSIPAGKVLVAFPSTDMLNATGAVQPGDHVDIMLTLPISGTTRLNSAATGDSQVEMGTKALVSQATLQNIEVYTIGMWTPPGQQADNNPNSAVKIITFIVDHQEALILKFVKDSGGTIDLAVRSALDNANAQTDPVNLDYLVDLFGFVALPDGGQGAVNNQP